MTSDNPAQRLFEICTSALELNGNKSTQEVWSQTLGIDSNDRPAIHRSLGILNELAEETRGRIGNIPNISHELFLEDLPSVEKALSPVRLDVAWSSYSTHLTSGAMKGLKFCANELAKHHPENPIARQTLTDLLAQADDLVKSVMEADIDPPLRSLRVDLLEMIRKSVVEYRLRGAAGIKDALVYFIGATVTNYDLIEKEKDKPIIQKVRDFVSRVDIVVTTAVQMKALMEKAAPLLELLPPRQS